MVEQLLEYGTALVRQQIVELGADARLLAHVRHQVTNDARDVLLPTAAVLHQRQMIADPCACIVRTKPASVSLRSGFSTAN